MNDTIASWVCTRKAKKGDHSCKASDGGIFSHKGVIYSKIMSQSLPIEVASVKATNKMQDDTLNKADTIVGHSKMLQDDLQKLGLKIKHHEDNLKFLKTQTNNLDESIFDMQVSLGKYHSSTVADTGSQNLNHVHTEQNTIEQILRQEKTAAGILCQLKTRHGAQASNLPLTKDVLGIVATLGKVNDDNHSRFFSEYLGLESMLAVVCKTYEGVKALELYDQAGRIDKSVGLHGLGQSIGRPMDGRFRVICLEDLMKDVEVRFPITLGNSNLPGDIGETAERIKLMKWEKERIDEDIKREETLLNHAKNSFDLKRQEFVKFLGETSPYVTQNEVKAERK
ncbi:protein DEFECTIVE IN MERISTEM SILENCING 3-like isoform X3 [Magnolia sinica]|uniref:protein DEFECTIVE IN MERISTEM SILENCING 3-like isoform X3 n=1 Tax=Magnolia sinica TaxID=86752 RepID=UPI002658B324|nr:protein DEFECTIVE IN MERISTEM SILENCING 3-like isoform X3 [Magnolia sinica]